jgi:hypothetical protein
MAFERKTKHENLNVAEAAQKLDIVMDVYPLNAENKM